MGSVKAFDEYPSFDSSDFDQLLPPALIACLADNLSFSPDFLLKASLVRFSEKFQEPHQSEITKWLLPRPKLLSGKGGHFRGSHFQGGGQYCPLCLDQADPYLHISWRFSFVTVCSLHKRVLSDRCPHCIAPVDTAKPAQFLDCADVRLHLRCKYCEGDLRGGSIDEVQGLSSNSMQSILQLQDDHLSLALNRHDNSDQISDYFAILHWAINSQLLNGNWKARPVRSEVLWMSQAPVRFLREVTEDCEVQDLGPLHLRASFKSLTAVTRAKLLSNCAEMLGRWPVNLRELATHFAGIRSSLRDSRSKLPNWVLPTLDCSVELPNRGPFRISLAQKVRSSVSGPTSPNHSVKPQICSDLSKRTLKY
ncbi:hypothetical protein AciX9_1016 [Granulicella tundricola MP5ACTX9]|uniref:TniQ domain-containing protein n=2 Tax=Granulicella TaxID=940557 RepID=E8X2E7_GRATM|nr:hypothetical protein AciX9_1016 [Granulicella tundricola MP5ACTX9]